MDWFVYILRCSDKTLYTGITNNLEKRYKSHLNKKGAKYTKSHLVINLETTFKVKNKSEASKLEYKIKKLDKKSKENLIKFKRYLEEK